MANIAKGFERGGRGEFHQFLSIARGSCAETRSRLYAGFDVGYLTPEMFGTLKEQTEEVTRLVAGLRSAVDRQRREQTGHD